MDGPDRRLLIEVLGESGKPVELENADVLRTENNPDPTLKTLLEQLKQALAARDALVDPYRKAHDKASRASGESMRLYGQIRDLNNRAAQTREAMELLSKRTRG